MSSASVLCAVRDGAILGRVLVDGTPTATFTLPCRVATDAAALRRAIEQAADAALADTLLEAQAARFLVDLGPVERPVPERAATVPVECVDGRLTAVLPPGVDALLLTADGVTRRVTPNKDRRVSVHVGEADVTVTPVDTHARHGTSLHIARRAP